MKERACSTPLGAVMRGTVAGAVGTVAMDSLWFPVPAQRRGQRVPTRRTWHGLILGAGVWVQSYVVLWSLKIYKPIWEYDTETLWKDLSAHLVYGLTTATTFRVLASPRRPPGHGSCKVPR